MIEFVALVAVGLAWWQANRVRELERTVRSLRSTLAARGPVWVPVSGRSLYEQHNRGQRWFDLPELERDAWDRQAAQLAHDGVKVEYKSEREWPL